MKIRVVCLGEEDIHNKMKTEYIKITTACVNNDDIIMSSLQQYDAYNAVAIKVTKCNHNKQMQQLERLLAWFGNRLKKFTLRQSKIRKISPTLFKNNNMIEEICFKFNKTLQKLPNQLLLSNNNNGPMMTQLRKFELSHCHRVRQLGTKFFANMPPSVQCLILKNNRIWKLPKRGICLPLDNQITIFDISNNCLRLCFAKVRNFLLSRMTNLKCFNVEGNNFAIRNDDDGLASSFFANNEFLETIKITDTGVHFTMPDFMKHPRGKCDEKQHFEADLYRSNINLKIMDTIGFSFFGFCKFLVRVHLSGLQIGTLVTGCFLECNSLESVSITNNNAKCMEIQQGVFAFLPNLKEVDLSHNRIKQLHDQTFYNCPLLQSVTLRSSHISAIASDAFEGCGAIRHLDFTYNNLDEMPKRCLEVMSENKKKQLQNQMEAKQNACCFYVGYKGNPLTKNNWDTMKLVLQLNNNNNTKPLPID